jgi:hypothetical protein
MVSDVHFQMAIEGAPISDASLAPVKSDAMQDASQQGEATNGAEGQETQ